MDVLQANNIMDNYVGWWRKQVSIYQEGDAVRIICPMLDRHNDHMSIYLAEDAGVFTLTDMGAILGDLALCGCDVFSSAIRSKKLSEVLAGYGLMQDDGEIYRKASKGELFQSINMLMQGMASVDDLFYTAKENARSFFMDDVKTWFDAKEIRYTDNVVYQGKSGFASRFDFCIPKTAGKAPERLIKTVGSPSEASVKNALFGWGDIRESRPNSMGYLFMNMVGDDGDIRTPDQTLVNACLAYDVKPVSWTGTADSVLEELAA